MRRTATLLVVAYGLMLLCVGTAGVVAARWELGTVFGLDPGGLGEGDATFLNQYRFLKAVELGAGAFCLMMLRPILDGGAAARAFFVLVAGGVAARSLAWIADGRPSWPFLAFLALEALVLLVFLLHWRQSHAE
jgi:hypothetical protein